ncbi:MAG: hypothetical protein M0019_10130 [Actinomycetota bacterium]|nr:hypothetical protein [Actinomycetota bacterium]
MKRCRWMAVFLVVIPMTLVAQLFHRSDLIFPEAAALTIGTWGGEAHAWSSSKLKLLLLPPLAASVAVAGNVLHVPTLLAFLFMVAAIPMLLDRLNSALIPTISAGALPTLFDITSAWFLLVVFAITATLSLGLYIGDLFMKGKALQVSESEIDHSSIDAISSDLAHVEDSNSVPKGEPKAAGGRDQNDIDEDIPKSPLSRRRILIWFIAISLSWTIVTWWITPHAALAPPLFVSFYEWMKSSNRTFGRYWRRWLSITLAISIGTFVHHEIKNYALSALVSISIAFFMMLLLGEIHPPTLAIALLPLIFTATIPVERAIDVSLSIAVLYGLGLYLPKVIRYRKLAIEL